LLAFCLLAAAAPASDQPPPKSQGDAVAKALDAAKSAYKASVEKARAPVLKALAKIEDEARDRGNVDAVRAIAQQREAFEKSGKIPDVVPTRDYRNQLVKARTALGKAYRDASRSYLKARKDEEANRLKEKWQVLESGAGFAQIDSEAGWKPLFNGVDFEGWELDGDDRTGWRVDDGVIVADGIDYGTRNYILTDRNYADFALSFEFSLSDARTGGAVAVRAIPGENLPISTGPIFDHPMLKLLGSRRPREQTGTMHWIVGGMFVDPKRPAKLNPVGSWNRFEMQVVGRRIRASINGEEVVDAESPRGLKLSDGGIPGLNRESGRIGFQKHTNSYRIRNIRIKELKAP
jgi:hypothetical protein